MGEKFDVALYRPDDRQTVLDLAGRLAVGTAPWRDAAAVHRSVVGWVESSIRDFDHEKAPVFVARHRGQAIGFITCGTRTHWAGDTDAYVGELVVDPAWSRHGLGQQLMRAMEHWAKSNGHRRVTLETGAANVGAREFYRALGYEDEEVVLSREL